MMRLRFIGGLLLSMFLLSALTTTAQSSISNGYLMYNISVDSDQPAAALLASMGSTFEVAFKGKKTKAVVKIAGASNTVHVVADHATVTGISLMNILGEQNAVRLGSEEYNEAKRAITRLSENPMRLTGDTKTIAGYVCQKILMKDKNTGANIILYVTDKINPQDPLARQLVGAIKGFPLSIVVRKDNTTVKATASKVSSQTPSDGAFSQSIPSGYTIKTIRELEQNAEEKIKQKR